MTRYLRRLAPLGGLLALAVVAFSASPAGATVVCGSGQKPPYCPSVKPTGITHSATNVKGTSATLNGTAGSTVGGGDPTQFFFKYGTSTAYGKQTPPGTLGMCQPGHTGFPPGYCTTPSAQAVFADISGLTPCTTYHFQLFASNTDGSASGGDLKFTTGFAKPLKDVKTPEKVKHGKKFKVKYTLLYNAKVVKIFIKRKNGSILKTYDYGAQKAKKYQKTIKAPKKKGQYTVEVHAKLACGSQSVKHKLKVH
jgi:hypothetical protein